MTIRILNRRLSLGMISLFLFTLLPAATFGAGPTARELIGTSVPIFAVATSQGTLANYQRDYYGKHHLILTFFPAAFTPV